MSNGAETQDEAAASARSAQQELRLVVLGADPVGVSHLDGAVQSVPTRAAAVGSNVAEHVHAESTLEAPVLGPPDGTTACLLPEGPPEDAPDTETVYGIGNRRNELLLKTIDADGVRVHEGSRHHFEAAAEAGLRRAVVSSSADTQQVLEVTGLAPLIDSGVEPPQAVVLEDALYGVERVGQAMALQERGADVAAQDLAELRA